MKTLAKHLPYGQCALRAALNNLRRAGHLRRGREHIVGSGSARWVTRTWFSRTPRTDDWWASFAAGDVTDHGGSPPQPPTRSRAFVLLAALGRENGALSLSAAECAELEPLADRWFESGATERDLIQALTAGLPAPVHSPAALIRSRLTTKLPPERPTPRPALRVLECGKCGAPGRPEALRGGECGPCRGETAPARPPVHLPPTQVHARAAALRAALPRARG
ncbi:hypothetical protein OG698_25955 [Streptomyces sp. NBC_01003]|uniref:hypothetical protein n=1 Tax=Streptomyces sp. NBC_01003 TaxID=2903714 RepID=UPI003865CA72|nr:hypothetical protein OG698_25955 [Streptomyces sp. NBC_01003]